MPITLTPVVLSAGVLALTPCLVRADFARLTLQSDPGDWIGQGNNYDIVYDTTASPASLVAASATLPIGGTPSYLSFTLDRNWGGDTYSRLEFSSWELGTPLTAGVYLDAQRAAFASPGHPGLDVSFQHRGSNTLTGQFTVISIAYAPDGSLANFTATFEQHSEGAAPALHGMLVYSAPAPSGALVLAGAGVLALRRRR